MVYQDESQNNNGSPTSVAELLLNPTILDVPIAGTNSVGRGREAALRFLQISAVIGIGRRSVTWRSELGWKCIFMFLHRYWKILCHLLF